MVMTFCVPNRMPTVSFPLSGGKTDDSLSLSKSPVARGAVWVMV